MMLPLSAHTRDGDPLATLTSGEEAIARSVLYAALFDYPLTLSQLRQTLIHSQQTATEITASVRASRTLSAVVEEQDGYYFPAGRADLIATRRGREARSRAFLLEHRPLLRLIGALPYVRMVALSGSIAHLNLDHGGDLDVFIVTRGARVWSTAVGVVVLAKLLRRRRTLCANFIVADTALRLDQQDLFTANQVIGLRPLTGDDVYRELLAANPFVRQHYPNFHPIDAGQLRTRSRRAPRLVKTMLETLLRGPAAIAERLCRTAYRAYLRGKAATWQSPEQVVLDDLVLKLHTRSHRRVVMDRYEHAIGAGPDEQLTTDNSQSTRD